LRVVNLEVAFDQNGSVISDGDFCGHR
jgi:hypothetical protein